MHKLDSDGINYFFTNTKNFKPIGFTKLETIERVFNFAYDMSFSKKGEHRDHRTGGQHKRKNGEIFINAFQGKLAELAVYNEIYKSNKLMYNQLSKPDFDVYGLGQWDESDLKFNELKFSIKSTKFYGNLLLLETRDWTNKAEYIPNQNMKYDYFILVRIKPDSESIMKKNKLLYANIVDYQDLKDIILNERWEYDIPGYIINNDLVYIINNSFVLPQNSLLNGKTKMDAENYYIQSGDFRDFGKLISSFN